MRSTPSARARNSLTWFGLSALLAATAATAQVVLPSDPAAEAAPPMPVTSGSGPVLDSSGRYRSEVQACQSGNTAANKQTCLREARNAQAERKRGTLARGNVDYHANAIARCNALSGEDKAACEARMMGYGTVTGSVAGGGILREVETVVVPPEATSVTVEPKGSAPVVVLPADTLD